jgi:hypothetical protein
MLTIKKKLNFLFSHFEFIFKGNLVSGKLDIFPSWECWVKKLKIWGKKICLVFSIELNATKYSY